MRSQSAGDESPDGRDDCQEDSGAPLPCCDVHNLGTNRVGTAAERACRAKSAAIFRGPFSCCRTAGQRLVRSLLRIAAKPCEMAQPAPRTHSFPHVTGATGVTAVRGGVRSNRLRHSWAIRSHPMGREDERPATRGGPVRRPRPGRPRKGREPGQGRREPVPNLYPATVRSPGGRCPGFRPRTGSRRRRPCGEGVPIPPAASGSVVVVRGTSCDSCPTMPGGRSDSAGPVRRCRSADTGR